ncbi:MAG: hypothetical protein AAF567_14175 [Actinomycetota bacterium]
MSAAALDAFAATAGASARDCIEASIAADDVLVQQVNQLDLSATPNDPRLAAQISLIMLDCSPEGPADLGHDLALQMFPGLDPLARVGAAECFETHLAEDATLRLDALTALIAVGAGQVAPSHSIDAAARLMSLCTPPEFLAAQIAGPYLEEPALASGLDEACIDRVVAGLDSFMLYRGVLTPDPLDELVTAADFTTSLLPCISLGTIYAVEANLTLSGAEVRCLDEALGPFGSELLERALQGSFDDDEADATRQALVDGCLSP